MRSIMFTALMLSAQVTGAAETPASPAVAPACELQSPGLDSRVLRCGLSAASAPKRFRLQVNFSGGHDDTKASMIPTLNGAPMTCEADSKTQLFGEDGDVSLACVFSVAPGGAVPVVFGATFTWSHAEYVDYAFIAL